MIEKELMDFLCAETALEDLGKETLLLDFPPFGKAVGEAINSGRLLPVTAALSLALDRMDLYKASLLTNFIGFACEKEENTGAGQGVIDLFAKSCPAVYALLEAHGGAVPTDLAGLYDKSREEVKAYYGFNVLCIATMAFLTRDTALRQYLREKGLAEKISSLAESSSESPYLKSVYYVDCMQRTCSALKLIVLHPEQQKGYVATANDLNNCFHLLFLLEEQLARKKLCGMRRFRAERELVQLAHGEYPPVDRSKGYTFCFMAGNFGSIWKGPEVGYMVWGEPPPEAIPALEGHAVIVLHRTKISRSFDAAFLAVPHTALKPYVNIERELAQGEYIGWIEKIKALEKQG